MGNVGNVGVRRGLCRGVAEDGNCDLVVVGSSRTDAAVVRFGLIVICFDCNRTFVEWAFCPGGVGMGNLGYGVVRRGLCIGCSAVELRLEAMFSVLLCATLDLVVVKSGRTDAGVVEFVLVVICLD